MSPKHKIFKYNYFNRKTYSSEDIAIILLQLNKAIEKGFVNERIEENPYVLFSVEGVESNGITDKWNVKIYKFSKNRRGHSIVCVDKKVLYDLVNENYQGIESFPNLPVLSIDDAGWGCPLCGVMVGVSDGKEVKTKVVSVEYFQEKFKTKEYLRVYADYAIDLISNFNGFSTFHRIEICTGYINQTLREELRDIGYHVRTVDIQGLLQDRLEKHFKAYVYAETGFTAYDPKRLSKRAIATSYYAALDYGKQNCPEQMKTGWKSMKKGKIRHEDVYENQGGN